MSLADATCLLAAPATVPCCLCGGDGHLAAMTDDHGVVDLMPGVLAVFCAGCALAAITIYTRTVKDHFKRAEVEGA